MRPPAVRDVLEPIAEQKPGTARVANAHAEGHAGLGLGFFIAKTLIERIGGNVTFANRPGKGALVRIALVRKSLESPVISRG